MRCPECGQEWRTNYCPICKKTIPEILESEIGVEDSDSSAATEGQSTHKLEAAQQFCTRCGQPIEMTNLFCGQCGAPIGSTAASSFPGSVVPQSKGTLPMANTSLILALTGILLSCCCGIGILLEPIALFLGIWAMRTLHADPAYKGHGLAVTSIIISAILILITLSLLIVLLNSDLSYYESFYTP